MYFCHVGYPVDKHTQCSSKIKQAKVNKFKNGEKCLQNIICSYLRIWGESRTGVLSLYNKTYDYDKDLLQEQWCHKGIQLWPYSKGNL